MNTPILPKNQSGFTLIEIMIVVIIMAVMSVAVVSSLKSNNDRTARFQANRFMAVVNEVRDEAIIVGDNFVLIVDEKLGIYRFESIRSPESSDGDLLLKTRQVDKKVSLDWQVFEVIESDDKLKPRVLISPLGEITPFEASFQGTEFTYVVSVDQEGQLERVDKKRVGL